MVISILGWSGNTDKKHLFVVMNGKKRVACRREIQASNLYVPNSNIEVSKCCSQCLRAKDNIDIINRAEQRAARRVAINIWNSHKNRISV